MTDFFGSVRNVELHNDTQYNITDEERFDGQLLWYILCLLFLYSLSSHDTKVGSHDAGTASLINENINFVSNLNSLCVH